MLTTESRGRALDFNRVIGGRIFRGLVHISFGVDNDVYVICRDSYNQSSVFKLLSRIGKISFLVPATNC